MSEGTEVKEEKNAWDGMLMKVVVRIKMTMGTNTNGRRNKIKKMLQMMMMLLMMMIIMRMVMRMTKMEIL